MKKTGLVLLGLFIVVSGSLVASAQDLVAELPNPVSPEKAALIREMAEVTGGKDGFNELMKSMYSFDDSQAVPIIVMAIDADKTLSPSAKVEAKKMATDAAKRTSAKVQTYFSTRFDFDQFVEKVYLPVYDKSFTEAELRDIIAFYRTPTGQKTVKQIPQLMKDSLVAISQHLLPQIQEFMKQTIDEEMAALKQKLVKKKPARSS